MEESSVHYQGGGSAPQAFRPGPGPVRVMFGVLISIATLGLTMMLAFLSLCFGLLMSATSGPISSSGKAFLYGLFAATVLVPISGTWLAVHLFRGPKPG